MDCLGLTLNSGLLEGKSSLTKPSIRIFNVKNVLNQVESLMIQTSNMAHNTSN